MYFLNIAIIIILEKLINMDWKTSNSRLYRSILIFGIFGVFVTSLLVALLSIIPLYLRLKGSEDDRITMAAHVKSESIVSTLSGLDDVADQIASRSAVRDELDAYDQGKVTLTEFLKFNTGKLADSLTQSKIMAGVQQFDLRGHLLIDLGIPIPEDISTYLVNQMISSGDHALFPVLIGNQLYLVTGRKIMANGGRVVGFDNILFKTDLIQRITDDIKDIGASAKITIFTKNGVYLVPIFSSVPLTKSELEEDNKVLPKLISGELSGVVQGYSRTRLTLVGIENSNWFVVVQVNEEELYREVTTQVIRVSILTIILMLLGMAGLVIVLRPLAQSLLVHERELEGLVIDKAEKYQAEYEERIAIEQDLRMLSARYQSVVKSAGDAIVIANMMGEIEDWNPAAETIFGYSPEEIRGKPVDVLVPKRILASHRPVFASISDRPFKDLGDPRGQWPAVRKDGTEFPADISLSMFESEGVRYIAAIIRDITELRNIETALEQSQERYKSMIEDVVDASSVAICITDPNLNIIWENDSAIHLWGLDRDKVIGSDKRILIQTRLVGQIENGEEFARQVLDSYSNGEHLKDIEIHFPAKGDSDDRWVTYSSTPIKVGYYAGGRIEQYIDITEQKQLLSRIEKLAITDHLTTIYNRRGLFNLGKRDIARAHRAQNLLCAIFLDIDHFKQLNDKYGHKQGDHVLIELSSRISDHTREMDLFARYGGEEFVILLPDISPEQAEMIAERIRVDVAEKPFTLENEDVSVTISVGVTCLEEADDLSTLLERADHVMYKAKQNGRNRVEMG